MSPAASELLVSLGYDLDVFAAFMKLDFQQSELLGLIAAKLDVSDVDPEDVRAILRQDITTFELLAMIVMKAGSGSSQLAAPAGIAVTPDNLDFDATFSAVTGAASYEWRLDGIGSWTNIGTSTSISGTGSAGAHVLKVRAIDGSAVAGHTGTSASFTLTGSPGGWVSLRSDTWSGADHVLNSDPPDGYAFINTQDDPSAGVKDHMLFLNRPGTSPILGPVETFATGGKIRAYIPTVNITAPPYGFAFGEFRGLFTGLAAGAPNFQFCLHYIDAATGPLFLTIRGNPRCYGSIAFPARTSSRGFYLEVFQYRISSTVFYIGATLFDTDGATELGRVRLLAYSDYPSAPALPTSGTGFGIGGQFTWLGQVDYYDYETGSISLAAGDPSIVSIASAGCVVVSLPATGGTGAFTYQWKKRVSGVGSYADISGATGLNASFALLPNTIYDVVCVVSDGSTTATSGTLTVDTTGAITIIAHGDSITEGNAGGFYYGFKDALEQELIGRGYTPHIYNLGMGATETNAQSGESVPNYPANAATLNTRVFADLIVFRAGTNDAGSSISTGTLATRIQAGPQAAALSAGIPFLYLCEPWTGISARETVLETYDAVFSGEASAHPGAIFWQGSGPRTATSGNTAMFGEASGSELHPNATGWAVLAPLDADAVETALGL